MLTIVTIENNTPTGWIIATDADEARRQLEGRGQSELAAQMYRAPYPLRPGKFQISPNTWALVD